MTAPPDATHESDPQGHPCLCGHHTRRHLHAEGHCGAAGCACQRMEAAPNWTCIECGATQRWGFMCDCPVDLCDGTCPLCDADHPGHAKARADHDAAWSVDRCRCWFCEPRGEATKSEGLPASTGEPS